MEVIVEDKKDEVEMNVVSVIVFLEEFKFLVVIWSDHEEFSAQMSRSVVSL